MDFGLITASDVVYIKGKDCGYCKGKKDPARQGYALESYRECFDQQTPEQYSKFPNSTTMGFVIYQCSPECYEDLMNRGFRRSGNFLYRPDMLRNCCRLYTIRTCLKYLKPLKEHRHTVNRFEKFIKKEKEVQPRKVGRGPSFNLKDRIVKMETEVDPERFHTVLGPASTSHEKYALFRKYQMGVHNETDKEVSEQGFKRFLCDTPYAKVYTKHENDRSYWVRLNAWRSQDGQAAKTPKEWVGPVHECYYLDGKLIAIAVLDLLPDSISSVYFIWDPDYHQLGLGTLSALRELVLTEMLGKSFYYMGYYIDDCPKMRYKAKFGGEILDMCTRSFVKLSDVSEEISGGRLAAFADGSGEEDAESAEIPLNEQEILDNAIRQVRVSGGNAPKRNVAEQTYGVGGGSFHSAERAAQKIVRMLPDLEGIAETPQEDYWKAGGKETLPLPLVSPGLVPMWQVKEMIQDGRLAQLLRNVYLYEMSNPGYYPISLPQDSETLKPILDLMRLIGPNQFERRVLYLM